MRSKQPSVEIRVFVCGTRAVYDVRKSPLHGTYQVRGATSGHVIKAYAYDDRSYYTEEGLAETFKDAPKAEAKAAAWTLGRARDEAKQDAIARAVKTSGVVTESDR